MAAASVADPVSICPKCLKEGIQKDVCDAEEMIVCEKCGHVFEAGSIDMRKDYESTRPQMSTHGRSGSKGLVKSGYRYPFLENMTCLNETATSERVNYFIWLLPHPSCLL